MVSKKKYDLAVPLPLIEPTMLSLEREFNILELWTGREYGLRNVRFLAANTTAKVGESLMARMPSLEIISKFGVGYDTIDVKAAAARGVVVTNTPGVLDEEVADCAVALLLNTIRESPAAAPSSLRPMAEPAVSSVAKHFARSLGRNRRPGPDR
jgi:phosphoglycerate dehydrogenase-like enzyme